MSEVVGISIYVDNRSLLGLLGTMALHAETGPRQRRLLIAAGTLSSILGAWFDL
jgi:hypothetical protein